MMVSDFHKTMVASTARINKALGGWGWKGLRGWGGRYNNNLNSRCQQQQQQQRQHHLLQNGNMGQKEKDSNIGSKDGDVGGGDGDRIGGG